MANLLNDFFRGGGGGGVMEESHQKQYKFYSYSLHVAEEQIENKMVHGFSYMTLNST